MTEGLVILHPGAMGACVAACAKTNQKVYWVSEGRSEASKTRAEQLGLHPLPDLASACRDFPVLVSVCPPHAAESMARQVRELGFRGLYLDLNALSPTSVKTIAEPMLAAGIDFVDGGIIGLPTDQPGKTWIYLSGPKAQQAASLLKGGALAVEVLGEEIGQASALKMCYAAFNKGQAALLAAVLGSAEAMGVRQALEAQWEAQQAGTQARNRSRLAMVAPKAWRFLGEMEEIAECFAAAGQSPDFHRAAHQTYSRLTGFKGQQDPDYQAILTALTRQGADQDNQD